MLFENADIDVASAAGRGQRLRHEFAVEAACIDRFDGLHIKIGRQRGVSRKLQAALSRRAICSFMNPNRMTEFPVISRGSAAEVQISTTLRQTLCGRSHVVALARTIDGCVQARSRKAR